MGWQTVAKMLAVIIAEKRKGASLALEDFTSVIKALAAAFLHALKEIAAFALSFEMAYAGELSIEIDEFFTSVDENGNDS